MPLLAKECYIACALLQIKSIIIYLYRKLIQPICFDFASRQRVTLYSRCMPWILFQRNRVSNSQFTVSIDTHGLTGMDYANKRNNVPDVVISCGDPHPQIIVVPGTPENRPPLSNTDVKITLEDPESPKSPKSPKDSLHSPRRNFNFISRGSSISSTFSTFDDNEEEPELDFSRCNDQVRRKVPQK